MEIHLERQTDQKLSLSAALALSSSSSSSSTSSSCSSSSFHNDAYSSSCQNEDRSWNAPRLKFMDYLRDNGREWKLVEKRFDQLSWTSVGSEPAVKWSNFAFCIGEMLSNMVLSAFFPLFLFLFQIIHSSQQSKTSMKMRYQKIKYSG